MFSKHGQKQKTAFLENEPLASTKQTFPRVAPQTENRLENKHMLRSIAKHSMTFGFCQFL